MEIIYTYDKNPTHAPFYIEAAAACGDSCKGHHKWDDYHGTNLRWEAEGQLAKKLPQAYKDIRFSFWTRFNPDAQSRDGSEPSKVLRAGAYNP